MGTIIASDTNNNIALAPADSIAEAKKLVAQLTKSDQPKEVRDLWTGAKYTSLDVPVGKEFQEYKLTGGTEGADEWTGGTIVEVSAKTKAILKTEIDDYWRSRVDEMNPVWAIGIGNPTAAKWYRWTTSRYRLNCGALCCKAACDDDAWDLEACEDAFEAYQILCPPGGTRVFMLRHPVRIWGRYFLGGNTLARGKGIHELRGERGSKPNPSPAYFHWTKGAPMPEFGDDFRSSTLWDGSNGTIAVNVPIDADPDSDT